LHKTEGSSLASNWKNFGISCQGYSKKIDNSKPLQQNLEFLVHEFKSRSHYKNKP
jgi:hypothetical protein